MSNPKSKAPEAAKAPEAPKADEAVKSAPVAVVEPHAEAIAEAERQGFRASVTPQGHLRVDY